MMNVPLARFLTRFPIDGEVEFVPPPPPPPPSPELTMSEAEFEAALAAARAEIANAYDDEIAALTMRLAAEQDDALAVARKNWCEEEGAALASHLDLAVAGLEVRLGEQVADVLRPLLAEAAVSHACTILIETLDLALADPSQRALVLRGPKDLLDAVRKARPNVACLTYLPGEGVEATLVADGLHIETKLAGALAALQPTEI